MISSSKFVIERLRYYISESFRLHKNYINKNNIIIYFDELHPNDEIDNKS